MPEHAPHCPGRREVRKTLCEIGGVTRMGCTRPPPKALRPNRRGQPWIREVHSQGEPDPVQETSRGSAHRRGAGSAFEVAGGRGSKKGPPEKRGFPPALAR